VSRQLPGYNPATVRCTRCGQRLPRTAHATSPEERAARLTARPHRGCGGRVELLSDAPVPASPRSGEEVSG
jgi:hypothetical protein